MKKDKYKSKYFPNRKISETLLEFYKPFLEEIDGNTTEKQIEEGLRIAVTVWNALSMDKWENSNNYIESLRSTMIDMGSYEKSIIDFLIERKNRLFNNDLRGISEFSVSYVNGYLNVKAEARLSHKFNNKD